MLVQRYWLGTIVLLAAGAAMLDPAAARADACDSQPTSNQPDFLVIPDCELQVQPPLTLKPLRTNGWAYYCTGDHKYYCGYQYSFRPSFTFDNS